MAVPYAPFSLDRMERAVDRVRQRLLRATAILQRAGIPYAVAGGNAVALWVSRVDESAVRNTRDVDVLLRREDLDWAKQAMERVGFVHRRAAGVDVFLDSPRAKVRDSVHIVFANEKVRPDELLPNPDVAESEQAEQFRVLSLEALVRIKLVGFDDENRVHLRDLIDVGLVDTSWPSRFPPELGSRLQTLLDNPEG